MISESRLNPLAVGNRSSRLQLNNVLFIVKFTIKNVRGAMNCATTNGLFLKEKLFFRNGIISFLYDDIALFRPSGKASAKPYVSIYS